MDFTLVQAVAQSSLPSSQRLLMLLLLNHANSAGRAWPSHATLAREAGLSERSVWAHVNALHRSGWLVKVGNHYRVAVFQVANPAASAASIPQNLPDAQQTVPQKLRDDPANSSAHPANIAAESRNRCGLTTQESPNNYPLTTHKETDKPSPGGEVEHQRPTFDNRSSLQHSAESASCHSVGMQASANACRSGVLQPSGALRRPGDFRKRQRTGALEDADAPSARSMASGSTGSLQAQPPKPGWREWNQRQASEANAVAPALHAPQDFHAAWQGWQAYRTRRATEARIASEAVRWTRDAAEAGLRECERAANIHGWPAIIARIDQAISGDWQGLNTDKIIPARQQHLPNPAHAAYRPNHSDTANSPGRYASPPPTLESIMSGGHRLPVTTHYPTLAAPAATAPAAPTPPTADAAAEDEAMSGSAYFLNQLNGRSSPSAKSSCSLSTNSDGVKRSHGSIPTTSSASASRNMPLK